MIKELIMRIKVKWHIWRAKRKVKRHVKYLQKEGTEFEKRRFLGQAEEFVQEAEKAMKEI